MTSLEGFEVQRHKQQLFVLDIWQHCHRHFELLCLAAASKQLALLATAHTFATRLFAAPCDIIVTIGCCVGSVLHSHL
jgi:hypothetical protein